jgi:4-diphosphocytidyl-2-C-methyl-D-erythritol kinase
LLHSNKKFYAVLVTENSFKLPAYAKINWFLKILGKRDDGFHELCTAFQTVSLHDNLTFSEADELSLSCNAANIPIDESNLILKAALLLKEKYKVRKGAKIYLEKNIPSPGGLGGGSSDGAIALLGLAKLWRLEIGLDELCEMGARLGSDVPFFFYGGTAIGVGRGTEITPIEDVNENFLLIVTPNVEVSTATAFGQLNAPNLTNYNRKSILKICHNEAEKLLLRQYDSKNDFESVIFKIEPEIERAKSRLLETGAKNALMSGSGASVFGIFDNEETRQASLDAIEHEHNWRKFAVATVSRASYRENLKVVSD